MEGKKQGRKERGGREKEIEKGGQRKEATVKTRGRPINRFSINC